MVAIVFTVGIIDVQMGINEAFILALGIIVATIPEGLPATVTLSLAAAVQRLAQKGVLVKKLSILETLEHVSVICTDKSGTLTQNQMTVRQVWVSGKPLVVTGTGYEPKGEFVPNPGSGAAEMDLHALLTAAMLCNNSRLNPPAPDHPQWTVLGDQTEAALRVLALKSGLWKRRSIEAYTYP
jgi:magnesium-transporting ATPase (P-type)